MEYRALGRSGLQVSEVSLGSWLTLGSSVDRETTREIVHRAFDLGINFFDTADVYHEGESEEYLAQALGERGDRVLIATKVRGRQSPDPNDVGLSRRHIRRSVEASLRRLRREASNRGKLVDATEGRRTRSILVLDSDHVVLSAIHPETLAARLGGDAEDSA